MEKRLDLKNKIIFKVYDVTTWLTNNCNTHFDEYLIKKKESGNKKFGQLIGYYMRNNLLEISYMICDGETFLRSFSKNEN